jgi:hypothetical protein
MLAIKKSCGDGSSTFWCCRTAGKHDPTTMKVCLGTGLYEGTQLVRMCQDQIDNAQKYHWKSLIPMEGL